MEKKIAEQRKKWAYQKTGPKRSLTSSSALPLNPSSAIFFAYNSSACLYSIELSNSRAPWSFVSRCPSVNAALHQLGRALCGSGAAPVAESADSSVQRTPRAEALFRLRCRACHTSDPSDHHFSDTFTHACNCAS